ncbi:hypothetical protein KFU94_48775 [Chloroflexi bacterium TSY]|nr:hypothetical protein [Chloroflexi bacterium TSY]
MILPSSIVIGYWLLVIGYWLLVAGYWLLVQSAWIVAPKKLRICHSEPGLTNQFCDARTDGMTILFHRPERRIPSAKQHLKLGRLVREGRGRLSWNKGLFAFLEQKWSVCVDSRVKVILSFVMAQNNRLGNSPQK